MQPYQIAILLGIGLAIAELMTPAFFFLGMAFAAWVVAALQFVMGDFSFNRDVLVFSVASVVFFLAFRKLFKRRVDSQALQSEDINHY